MGRLQTSGQVERKNIMLETENRSMYSKKTIDSNEKIEPKGKID